MFSRFTSLTSIRGSEHDQTVQDRDRTRPGRRPSRGIGARFPLEKLEDRRLLSAISSITEFSVPGTNGTSPTAIAVGPDGNLWFTEAGANEIGMINPTTHAISSFAVPTANCRARRDHGGP